MIVPVVGSTPGRRYGHSIIFSKPHLLVFGGNTGTEAVNDVWCLSVEKAPFSWIKLDCGREALSFVFITQQHYVQQVVQLA